MARKSGACSMPVGYTEQRFTAPESTTKEDGVPPPNKAWGLLAGHGLIPYSS
jgi:hypothetical protein